MRKNPRAQETLKKAARAHSVWQTIPDFKMGSVSLNDFTATMKAAEGLAEQHAKNAVDGSGLKANRDDKVRELNDLVVRFLTGIHSSYGPDSPLYEQAGGTRPVMRKSPKRHAAQAPAAGTTETPPPAAAPATNTARAQHA
jgi:hypothetical protein